MRGPTLNLDELKRPICAVVKLATQPAGVLQQVTLRPDKVSEGGLIRLGETRGDEARCWISPENVVVVEVLGEVECVGNPADEVAEWRQVGPVAVAKAA